MAAIRLATSADLSTVLALVNAAYEKYIPRIGRKPMPMTADYAELIGRNTVYVMHENGLLCGVLVLWREGNHVLLENIAVSPAAQGQGYGKLLMQFVESFTREQGLTEILLYTNEKMVENIAIYQHLGYMETERRAEKGFARVFMAKQLV